MNRFCTACGKSLDGDAIFCGACGKRVRRDGPASPGGSSPGGSSNAEPGSNGTPLRRFPAPSSQPRQRIEVEEPPESVFAVPAETGAGNGGGTIGAEPDPAYFDPDWQQQGSDRRKWIIGGSIIGLLLLAGLYYAIFLADDIGSGGKPMATANEKAKPEVAEKAEASTQYYANSSANIRDKSTTKGSNITGKLARGDSAAGSVITGEDGGEWLKLQEGKGFVFLANLSASPLPTLAQNFGRRAITLPAPAELLSAPSADAEVIDRLSKGLSIALSGVTGNDYAEVILKKGGVAYIANGAALVKAAAQSSDGKPIAIKLDANGCPAGGDMSALFQKLGAQRRKVIDDAEKKQYASEAERQAAIDKAYTSVEGQSSIMKLSRSFEGLTVVGIAQHYEARSVYFAESPDKVREVFRGLGYEVGSDGTLKSEAISAGIYGNQGGGLGKTDLQCGA